MEAAGGTGPAELRPGAPGEPPRSEALDGPGQPAEPGPEEEPESREPEERGPEEPVPPAPEAPPEPAAAAGPPGPSSEPSEPAPSVAAAGGAGEAVASGGAGAAGEAPPAARAEGAPGPPAPAAPDGAERRSGEAAGEAPAEEGEEERQERAALLEQHRGLAGERERLRQAGARLQLRLGELLRQAGARLQLRLGELLRLRQGERRRREDPGGPQLYAGRLLRLQELREQREREAAACRERAEARRRDGEEREARAQAEWAAFQARKKAVALGSLGRRLGGTEAAARAVERIQAGERDKEQRVREARLENIKLKHEIQNLETTLKAQGELVKSQHFMDFEHMKKENQKHSKKIDDLSGEILKLKKKVSNTVHILSQFREKLQFVEAENQGRRAELMDIETILSQKRDILTKTKQARDRLRRNNLKLQQKCGLLGNEILLRDFEEKVDTVELLSQRLETLKHHHARLILSCRGIQKKIKEASSSFPAGDD